MKRMNAKQPNGLNAGRLLMATMGVIICMGMIAACAQRNSAPATTAATAATSATVAENAASVTAATDAIAAAVATSEAPYEVAVQIFSFAQAPAESELKKVEDYVNAISVPAVGAAVKLYVTSASNMQSETELAIASGEKIDLICNIGTGVSGMVSSGLIIPLDELYKSYGEALEEKVGDTVICGYYDGKLYGIPSVDVRANDGAFEARTDLLEKYGFDIDPGRYYSEDELDPIFAAVKEGEGDGFYCAVNDSAPFDIFVGFLGSVDAMGNYGSVGGIVMDDGDWNKTKIENVFASDAYKTYAMKRYEWAQKGYIPPDQATYDGSSSALIKAGNVLGRFTAVSTTTELAQNSGFPITVIRTREKILRSDGIVALWSIPITSENPGKAMQFLDLMYQENDIDNTLMFGIEGDTWELVEKDAKGNRLAKFADGLDANNAPYYQQMNVYGDRFSEIVFVPNTLTANEDKRVFDAEIKLKSPAFGYAFIIGDDFAPKVAAVNGVIEQYRKVFAAGVAHPEETLPEFIKSLEAAGINELVAENQKQFDAWLAIQ
jgi:putative aldouronate transport system substrate-binding protein